MGSCTPGQQVLQSCFTLSHMNIAVLHMSCSSYWTAAFGCALPCTVYFLVTYKSNARRRTRTRRRRRVVQALASLQDGSQRRPIIVGISLNAADKCGAVPANHLYNQKPCNKSWSEYWCTWVQEMCRTMGREGKTLMGTEGRQPVW